MLPVLGLLIGMGMVAIFSIVPSMVVWETFFFSTDWRTQKNPSDYIASMGLDERVKACKLYIV
jgi:hypothetical protein